MHIPPIFDSWLSVLLYFLFLFIIGKGIQQFVKIRFGDFDPQHDKIRSTVPLGAAAVAFGFLGHFRGASQALDAIEAAGDISPSLLANALGHSGSYPVLGLLCLGLSFVFKYLNQVD